MKKRGFSLIELLVVITVIGILIAVLLPALGTVKERSKRTKCLNNVRQIATAASSLFGESGDKLPGRSAPLKFGEAAEQLMPYLKNIAEIFDCPSNPGLANNGDTQLINHSGKYTEYELNGYICSYPGNTRRQNGLTDLSKAAYVYDYPYSWFAAEGRAHGKTRAASDAGAKSRLDEGVNCGFLDGHASWLPDSAMGDVQDPVATNHFFRLGHIFSGP